MRIGTKLGTLAAGGLALAAIPLATTSTGSAPGQAEPRQLTSAYAQPAGNVTAAAKKYCVSNNHGATACFQPYGDKIYVKDSTKLGGYGAVARWRTNYGREGSCFNFGGGGKWFVCNYNMREGRRITFWAANVNPYHTSWRNWSPGRTATI